MFECSLKYPASAIAGKHRLTAEDALLLRRHMFPRGVVSIDEASQLVRVHTSAGETSREWDLWFVETLAIFMVMRIDPRGALDVANADFMIGALSQAGVVRSAAELELLLHCMEMAVDVPDVLTVLALDQLRLAILTGNGAYAQQRLAKRPGISQGDIDFIYRILRGSVVLYPSEITVIEAIDAIVRGDANHPAWASLVKSIALRDIDGRVSAEPWLNMVAYDLPDADAA
jgi:hypothetical protein